MPLELQLNRSKYFYGRLQIGGKSIFLSLRVPVEGCPPVSLRQEGDAAFERCRARAQAKLDRLSEQLRERATREELAQRVLAARTGSRLGSIALSVLAERWIALPRKRTPAVRYVASSVSAIRRFETFMRNHFPTVKEMAAVQEEMAFAFMASELERGIAGKTYNGVLVLLRSCFERLRKSAGIAENPFGSVPTRDADTISRIPFTEEELAQVLVAAEADRFIYPLVAIGASTAMRLGDCAQLRWEQLDLANGFVDVKSAKTGALVTIPVFAPLLRALDGVKPLRAGFVFSDLARQYKVAPDRLTNRVRAVFRAIGFGDPAEDGAITRGSFSVARPQGLRRASVRDFHSFRTTWVTIALNRGVPMEIVTKVTGHRTAEIVLKNYHRPGRADFRNALEQKLPNVLTGGSVKRLPILDANALVTRLKDMTAANWEALRDELVCDLTRGGD